MRLDELMPQKIGQWTVSGQDQTFVRANIFDYLNGGGEVYLGYDFRELLVREYLKPGEGPIVAEIYDMGLSGDAYGIFTHDSDGESLPVGQGALYGAGLVRFWKNTYFVRILAEKETAESKNTVMALGAEVAGAIRGEGEKPRLISCLPEEGLIKDTVRYFHTQVSLNNHLFLGDANVLDLSRETDVALARYQTGQQKSRLLIAMYRNEPEARAAYQRFGRRKLSPLPEAIPCQGATNMGRFIVLVFETPDEKEAANLINKAIPKIKEVFDGT